MFKVPEFDPIAYLVHRRYPHPISAVAKRYGHWPDEPKPSDPADQLLKRLAFEQELRAIAADELASLVATARAEDAANARAKAEATERQYFFNQPGAAADFSHWAKASYWT